MKIFVSGTTSACMLLKMETTVKRCALHDQLHATWHYGDYLERVQWGILNTGISSCLSKIFVNLIVCTCANNKNGC